MLLHSQLSCDIYLKLIFKTNWLRIEYDWSHELLSNHWACLGIRISHWSWTFVQLLSLLVCLCHGGVIGHGQSFNHSDSLLFC